MQLAMQQPTELLLVIYTSGKQAILVLSRVHFLAVKWNTKTCQLTQHWSDSKHVIHVSCVMLSPREGASRFETDWLG